jgi:hypothetical protein
MRKQKYVTNASIERFLLCSVLIYAAVGVVDAKPYTKETQNQSECSVRASIFEYAVAAFNMYPLAPQEALAYVQRQMVNRNLKSSATAVMERAVRYMFEVSRPLGVDPANLPEIYDHAVRQCESDPASYLGGQYIVDLDKAFSKDTEGQYAFKNKDGTTSVCHAGQCESRPREPMLSMGQRYSNVRKELLQLNWTPAAEAMPNILYRSQEITADGYRVGTGEMYGNCLIDHSACDPASPEYFSCWPDQGCMAAWGKDGNTRWYFVKNGKVTTSGSAPKDHGNGP